VAEKELFAGEEAEVAARDEAAAASGSDLAAAYALERVQDDPEVRDKAAAFLDKQTRLVELQREVLESERALRLHHLKDQGRESGQKRFGQRLRNAFQLFLTGVATVIGVGFILMMRDAITSERVVVEPFDAPPSMADDGINGRTVAAGLLDQLTQLQAATRVSAAKRNLESAWTGDIKLEVPETGVSIGELDRLLHERFGHDTHIEGDLIRTAGGGLALTVRGDGVLPKTFSNPEGDLEKLTVTAAEYVYGSAEPFLFTSYLSNQGRDAEALTFVASHYAAAKPADRPFMLNVWGNALGNTGRARDSLERYRETVRLKPDYWPAWNNVMNALWGLQDEEGAWRAGQEMLSHAGGRPKRKVRELFYQNLDTLNWNLPALRAALESDMQENGGLGSQTSQVGPSLADVAARQHDPAKAEFYLATSSRSEVAPDLEALTHFVRGYLAMERGEGPTAASEMEAFQAAYANPSVFSNYPGYGCWVAPAEALAGRFDKAEAALDKYGRYVDCYRFRADIQDQRGDWAGARKAYAAAIGLAPDMPAAYESWGLALARHGDLEAAKTQYAAAAKRGPGWGDPHKAWGDALAAQGQWKAALEHYDAALKLAPAWPALQQARARAASHA
jgi:tetratricopeptide (TPR) repeat protein